MKHRWKRSIALRVVSTSLVLSLLVIWLSGSLLISRVTDGLLKSRVELSLNSAASTRLEVEKQFDSTQVSNSYASSIDRIVATLSANAANGGQEIVILQTPDNPVRTAVTLDRTSNFVDVSSVPVDLRKATRKSDRQTWAYSRIRYANGSSQAAVVVGSPLVLTGLGSFELYSLFPLTSESETLSLLTNALVIVGGILILLVGFITWLVVRQVVTPVRVAARIARQISAGDLEQRMQIQGEDDLATLAQSFNEMTESLQKQITVLEELSGVQQRFVSDVSHELRTPLTTVRMASEVLYSAREQLSPAAARSAELLHAQLDRFEALLTELMEMIRFDSGVAQLEITRIRLSNLVRKVIDSVSLIANNRSIEIQTSFAGNEVDVLCDQRRIERALTNILVNAIEHCNEKPILIQTAFNLSGASIGVRDFGIGMTDEQSAHVFDRFYRGDSSRARTLGGTGLGLSIASENVKLHGGFIEVASQLGIGTQFVMTVPLSQEESIIEAPLKAEIR